MKGANEPKLRVIGSRKPVTRYKETTGTRPTVNSRFWNWRERARSRLGRPLVHRWTSLVSAGTKRKQAEELRKKEEEGRKTPDPAVGAAKRSYIRSKIADAFGRKNKHVQCKIITPTPARKSVGVGGKGVVSNGGVKASTLKRTTSIKPSVNSIGKDKEFILLDTKPKRGNEKFKWFKLDSFHRNSKPRPEKVKIKELRKVRLDPVDEDDVTMGRKSAPVAKPHLAKKRLPQGGSFWDGIKRRFVVNTPANKIKLPDTDVEIIEPIRSPPASHYTASEAPASEITDATTAATATPGKWIWKEPTTLLKGDDWTIQELDEDDGRMTAHSFHSLPEWGEDGGWGEPRFQRPKKRRFLWANGRTTSSLDVEVVDKQVATQPSTAAALPPPPAAPAAAKFRAITWKPIDDDVILRETKGSRGWPWSR